MASSALQMYEKIGCLLAQSKVDPISSNAKLTAIEAYDHLRCHHYINEAESLITLLARPHIKSLLLCHDTIANKAYEPTLPEVPPELDEDSIVNIVNQSRPLGATFRHNCRTGALLVASLIPGSVADKSLAIEVGDELLEVNGTSIRGRDPTELGRILGNSANEVKLKLLASRSVRRSNERNDIYIRTLFSYSPMSDPLVSSPEAGLPFFRGEILRLTDFSDKDWWYAVKVEFSPTAPAVTLRGGGGSKLGVGSSGIIPSRNVVLRNTRFCSSSCNFNRTDQLLDPSSYEEVGRYLPEEGTYRPIVLVGPPGVGKTELVLQLINTDPNHFREPIRITTRDPRPGEVHGIHYLFVTPEEFNTFVEAESLIDQSSFTSEEMTGLCVDAVLEIIQAGQVAIFEADYRNLEHIRSSLLKPFVVYISPPSIDVLLETRLSQLNRFSSPNSMNGSTSGAGVLCSPARSMPAAPKLISDAGLDRPRRPSAQSTPRIAARRSHEELRNSNANHTQSMDYYQSTGRFSGSNLTETQLREMSQIASRIEVTHGHLWDCTLVNDDLPVVLEQLSELAYRVETEELWVPLSWLVDMHESSGVHHTGHENAVPIV